MASKSTSKRVAAQNKRAKESKIDEGKVLEEAKGPQVDVHRLLDRVERLEKRFELLVSGLEFAANELRPLFGFGHVAKVFDAVAERLKK
jgi:hypothetical protein